MDPVTLGALAIGLTILIVALLVAREAMGR